MTGVTAWQDSVADSGAAPDTAYGYVPGDSAWSAHSSAVATAPFPRPPEYHAPWIHYGVAVAVVALAAFWLWQTRGGRRK